MNALPFMTNLIAGDLVRPARELAGWLTNPNTGADLQPRIASTSEQVDTALAAATHVHDSGSWYDAGPETRAGFLDAFAEHLTAHLTEIAMADALNSGVLHGITKAMAEGAPDRLRAAADHLRSVGQEVTVEGRGGGPVLRSRAPWGPAVIIGPWNAPIATVIGKIASALAAGNPVILKPSEWAPSSAHYLAEAAVAAGLPSGVFQVVHGDGDTGSQLVADPRVRIVSFTGSSASARSIAVATAPNFTRLQLEASGNNPVIVRADAGIELTVDALASGITKLNGQWCEGPGKVIVHENVYQQILEQLIAHLSAITVGSNFDEASQLGPLSHDTHRADLQSRIDHLVSIGGTAHSTAAIPTDGWFFSPTIVTGVAPDDATAELFGPVVTLHSVSGDEEAVAAARRGGDGLGGYVFSTDVERAVAVGAQLRAGEVKINGTSLVDLVSDSRQSFWGTSGYGGHTTLADELEIFRGDRIIGLDNPDFPI
jgi:betaine-aldehyde dehydrogenase